MGNIGFQSAGFIATAPLFSELNISIGDGDRVGLVAGNGGGKTTLLNCVAREAELSTGQIIYSSGLKLGYVEQGVPKHLQRLSLRDAVVDAMPADLRETEAWRADVALDSLSAADSLRDRPVSDLSGGWKRLMLIARVWVNDPDALLLDEPTNHLDLGKIFQLEEWLNNVARNMPVIIASHDRDFLDATTNRTLFLRPENSQYFALPYSKAKLALEEFDAAAERKLEKDLKEADRLRRQAAKLTNIGINSGSDLLTVKSKQLKDRAAKIERSAQGLHREHSGDIRLGNSGTHAKVLLAVDDVPVHVPNGELLFRTGKLHIFQGDRIVLLGRNGTGKSQLIKLLHSAIRNPDAVEGINVTPSVALGYLDQELSDLSPNDTPEDIVAEFGVGDTRMRSLLAGAGFPIEKQKRPLSELSFGQRARLSLLALRLKEPNFYLLDEPTNHMDIPAQERLEEEILKHEASCVLVSHDRRFVRNIGTRYLLIERKKLIEVPGPEDFFAEMSLEHLA